MKPRTFEQLATWVSLYFCISLLLMSCISQPKTQEDDLPYVDASSIGNIRIALIRNEQQEKLVLVNQSNSQYLTVQDFAKDIPRSEVPITGLKYSADLLGFADQTMIVIVEDEVMAKLMALFQKYSFETFASPCSKQDLLQANWPPRDGIFLEQNQACSILLKEPRSLNPAQQATAKGTTYRILKNYILQAHQTGYSPVQIIYNVDGTQLFQKSQEQLHQDSQKHQK